MSAASSAGQRITEWVRLYTKDLLAWAQHRTSDPAAAEDLVQETFLAALERIASFRSDSQPRTWLFAILNNKIADHYRRTARSQTLPFDEERAVAEFFAADGHWTPSRRPAEWTDTDESQLLDDEEFRAILDECLAALPPQWHSCITLRFLSGADAEAICQELGLSQTNYWQVIHRAKLRLRECLQQHWFTQQ